MGCPIFCEIKAEIGTLLVAVLAGFGIAVRGGCGIKDAVHHARGATSLHRLADVTQFQVSQVGLPVRASHRQKALFANQSSVPSKFGRCAYCLVVGDPDPILIP